MKFLILLHFFAFGSLAQNFLQRGFLETGFFGFPQEAPGDRSHAIAEGLLRYEASYKPSAGWMFNGALDLRTDTHRQVERKMHLSWLDRETMRPAFAIRRLSVSWHKDKLSVEVGRQFVRWGKADILNPTDRFAPRDFLNVVQADFLAIPAARVTYGTQSDTVDVIWNPLFVPSRAPLLSQRWAVLPEGVPVKDGGARYPGGSQAGIRWNHVGSLAEYSLSFFDGYNHLPLIDANVKPAPLEVTLRRSYPTIRSYGGDLAMPLRWLTVKGEAAYFTSPNRGSDDYLLYVAQLERQSGEWSLVGGYAGEYVTTRRSQLDFAPDRGLARAFLGRAGYTIDVNRSVALETAIRQNAAGAWLKFEYSQAFGQHWRATAGFTLMRGEADDFLGQYRRNSHARLLIRYSF